MASDLDEQPKKSNFSWVTGPVVKGKATVRFDPRDSYAWEKYYSPALGKDAAVRTQDPHYPDAVSAFNQWLSLPSDARPMYPPGYVPPPPPSNAHLAAQYAGWQSSTQAGRAALEQRYGRGVPGTMHGPNSGVEYEEGVAANNPHLDSPDDVTPPVTYGNDVAPLTAEELKGRPELTNPTPATPPSGDGGAVHPITGEPVAGSRKPTLSDYRRQQWISEGGTPHTLHQAQVAAGIRPAIDARAPLAARDAYADGSPSEDIRSSWGWDEGRGPMPSGDYSFDPNFGRRATWLPNHPMTRRAANQQADWNKRFDTARSRIYDALGN